MFKLQIFELVSFALLAHCSSVSSIRHIAVGSDENAFAEKSLECLLKYFSISFKAKTRIRFVLIQEPFLHQSHFEQLFLGNLHEQLIQRTILLTKFASLDSNRRENYLVFLSSEDIETLRNISISNANVNSFLYVFYEQTDASISLADVHSIFESSFEQNVVLAMSSRTNSDSFEWNVFRVLLLKCGDSKQYNFIKIGQCRGDEEFRKFSFDHMNDAICPVQVIGRYHPPFTYSDPNRGLYDGIDYHLIRLISEQLKMPMEVTILNKTTLNIIGREAISRNTSIQQKNNMFLRQVEV